MITTLAAIQLNYKKDNKKIKKKTMTNTQSFLKRPSESKRLNTKEYTFKDSPKVGYFQFY